MSLLAAGVASLVLSVAFPATAAVPPIVEESIVIPVFGKVSVYRPAAAAGAKGVILFVSGDGGWNQGVVEMARRSAPRAIVVGLSMPAWAKIAERRPDRCWYPAGELEATAQTVEKIYRLPEYLRPILIGYSSGATLVYAALAQAPAEAFAGAVSLGFCPDLEVNRPVCPTAGWKPVHEGARRRSLLPARADLAPRAGGPRWIALQGEIDQVCDPAEVRRFAGSIPAAKVVPLAKVGHGFSVTRNWGAAFDAAVEELLAPAPRDRAQGSGADAPAGSIPEAPAGAPSEIRARLEALGLPLEIQWPAGAGEALIFVSGDGGWAELDQGVAGALAREGVAVVGLNALRYFWRERDPADFAADLARVVELLPGGIRVLAGGYSFGAEVVPAALARSARAGGAAAASLSRVSGLVLLAPGPWARFEVSPLDWLRSRESRTEDPVPDAIRSVALPALCLAASQGEESGCPEAAPRGVDIVVLPGGHHFSGDYAALARRILAFIRPAA